MFNTSASSPVYVFSYRAYTLKDGDRYTEMKSNLQTVREKKSVLLAKTKERSSPGLMFCESCWAAANMLAADSRN